MTTGHWHGTRKCAINGAKIPRHQQVAGRRCPFCGNILGEYESRKAPSLEAQLEKLQNLHDDGVISEDELRDGVLSSMRHMNAAA